MPSHKLEHYSDILSKCEIFNGLEYKDIDELLIQANARIKSYAKNSIVASKGNKCSDIYVVLDGQLKTSNNDNTTRSYLVEKISPSQSFALAYCLAQFPTYMSLIATHDSIVLVIDYNNLMSSCLRNRELYNRINNNLLCVLAGKVVTLSQKIDYVHIKSLRSKLAAFILNCRFYEHSDSFCVNMNRTELAEYLGVSRSSMTKELSLMQSQGMLEYNRNRFTILDLEALRNAAI